MGVQVLDDLDDLGQLMTGHERLVCGGAESMLPVMDTPFDGANVHLSGLDVENSSWWTFRFLDRDKLGFRLWHFSFSFRL